MPSNTRSATFDTRIYRLNAVKKAAYRFGDRCHLILECVDNSFIRVILNPKSADADLDRLVGEFQNEVLDQELREVVAAETEGVRNLIIAQAFSETNLLDPLGECGEYESDPLKIVQPDRLHSKE